MNETKSQFERRMLIMELSITVLILAIGFMLGVSITQDRLNAKWSRAILDQRIQIQTNLVPEVQLLDKG